MIDTKAIRSKILDAAVRGLLTQQLPEDETAEELYQQIQKEKQKLIKAGKIKKEKPLPEIKEEEIPFEIPENWKWVRLGDISEIAGGTTPNSSEISTSGTVPYFKVSDMNVRGNELYMIHASNYVLESYSGKIFSAGSIIYPKNGGAALTNKRRILSVESAIDLNTGGCTPIIISTNQWIRLFFETIDFGKMDSGSNIPTVNSTTLKKRLIPLPPLAEQKRIVEKVDMIFSLLDKIDMIQKCLVDNFAVLKSKLIDAAVRGQITQQLSKDGTAEELYQKIQKEKQKLIEAGKIKKEKPLPEITEDEIPFKIPKGWRWCRLEAIFNFIDYRGSTPNKISEGVPFVTAKNVRQGYIDYKIREYISEEDYNNRMSRGISHKGDLLFTTEAPMGYAAIADLEKFSAGQRLITLQQYTEEPLLENKYFMYAISTQFFQKQLEEKCSGTTVKGIKADRLKAFLIPLPPLSEQRRIVERLDELLALCGG